MDGVQEMGPCSLEALVQLLHDGRLPLEARVWAEGLASWTPAREVPALMEAVPPPDEARAATQAASVPAPGQVRGRGRRPARGRPHRGAWAVGGIGALGLLLGTVGGYQLGLRAGRNERSRGAAPARAQGAASRRAATPAVLSAADIAARARAAVVVISGLDTRGRSITGSGFFATPDGLVVTNEHVVHDAVYLRVTTSDSAMYDDIGLVAADAVRDLAVLKVPVSGASALPIGRQGELAIGDRVYVMGNPLGFEWTFSDGLLSARREEDHVTTLQITAPISRGSSGGPVLSQWGAVVGIARGIFQGGQNLNTAVPAEYAQPLLRATGEPRRFVQSIRPMQRNSLQPGDPTRAGGRDRRTLDLFRRIRTLEREGFSALGSARDRLLDGDSAAVVMTLASGHTYAMLGACDARCADIDLVLKDPSGGVAEYDLENDARPAIVVTAADSGEYELVVRMTECSAEPCAYKVALLGRSD